VDETMIGWKYFADHLFFPQQPGDCPELGRYKPSEMSDTVEEMRGWYCFSEEAQQERERWEAQEAQRTADAGEWGDALFGGPPLDIDPTGEILGTFRRETPRVGRNDPCPAAAGRSTRSAV
jgi:hypothetical protein